MKIPIYQVDAFTSEVFSGNPAAICLLEGWLDDHLLQAIAAENNLSETAFLVRNKEGYDLRWFTPVTEVALCGHATLASAYLLFNHLDWPGQSVIFQTRKSGQLFVTRKEQLIEMDFPSRPPVPQAIPEGLEKALGAAAEQIFGSEEDMLVVLPDEDTIRRLQPDLTALAGIERRGIIVTAKGERSDFVSRFFAPRVGIPEDPVTGSAHCVLVPYWSGVLGKRVLYALQLSRRGGELFCADDGERVKICGRAVLYLEGTIRI
ncbi:MAG: PhzF family phenazine biosynthesis protein [Nitrospirota bacterium]|nr:PhzF family phenazine biosynthesis protein [Nitrospirota bacterium]